MNKQQGFTLIELIVVIIILGILAATAVPKFVAVDDDANKAVAQGLAAAFSSNATMQFARNKASGSASFAPTCAPATDLQTGAMPTQCSISVAVTGTCTGGKDTCTVSCNSQTAVATLPCYP